MKLVIIDECGPVEGLWTVDFARLLATRGVLVVRESAPPTTVSVLAVDELLEKLPDFFLGMDLVAPEVIRPLSVPWWHLHDIPELLDPPAQGRVPRRSFRPVHQPGSSGKRTRQSQKLHNRRAA